MCKYCFDRRVLNLQIALQSSNSQTSNNPNYRLDSFFYLILSTLLQCGISRLLTEEKSIRVVHEKSWQRIMLSL